MDALFSRFLQGRRIGAVGCIVNLSWAERVIPWSSAGPERPSVAVNCNQIVASKPGYLLTLNLYMIRLLFPRNAYALFQNIY